jgi:NarL family two-component system sensor histidine kinase LiaS
MSLEIILLIAGLAYSDFWENGTREYLSDIISTLVPDARTYLQPEIDTHGLQVWLDTVYRRGYASLDPQDAFDSPAAKIVSGSVMTILSPSGQILAQSPENPAPTFRALSENVIANAQSGSESISDLFVTDSSGNYWMAVPIFQKDHKQPVLGILVLTVATAPQRGTQQWLDLIGLILLAGFIMLLAIAPLGAIFGFIFSRGLTGRLKKLTTAAEAWGEGNFQMVLPVDKSPDEIGKLGLKMREMAEKISNLLQDQKALAQMKERNRLAQELHDTVRQQNFATLMQIRAARNQIAKQPEAAAQALVEAENLLKNTQNQLVLLISEMRPPELEGKGLSEAIKEYLQTWSQQACIPVDFQETGSRQLPFEVEKALFRVTQEALSNILRHSRATAASVFLQHFPAETHLVVQDNGVGFDPERKDNQGFGLISMKQRVAEIGGTLEVKSSAEAGTSITIVIPVKSDMKSEQ